MEDNPTPGTQVPAWPGPSSLTAISSAPLTPGAGPLAPRRRAGRHCSVPPPRSGRRRPRRRPAASAVTRERPLRSPARDRRCRAGRPAGAAPHQAQLVQCRGAQRVDQPPDIVDRLSGAAPQRHDELGGSIRFGAQQVAGGISRKCHPRQRRAQAVVQVPAQPAALFLQGSHDVLPGTLHRRRQRGRVHCHGQRGGQ